MWWAADLLASEYGGGLHSTLENISLYEVIFSVKKINARRVSDWKMQAALNSVPWMEKKDKEAFFKKLDALSPENKKRQNKFDKAGFEALKMALSQNPRFIVK